MGYGVFGISLTVALAGVVVPLARLKASLDIHELIRARNEHLPLLTPVLC